MEECEEFFPLHKDRALSMRSPVPAVAYLHFSVQAGYRTLSSRRLNPRYVRAHRSTLG